MNILLTNHHLFNYAGSELFLLNLSKGLKRRGHNIFVFSPYLGKISEDIKKIGIRVTDNLKEYKNEKIDIIHAQHNITAIMARSIFPNLPMIFVSHSTVEELEQTSSIDLGISLYVAISEKIKENLEKYNIASENIKIVRNIIDTDKYISQRAPNIKPKKLLILSNHYGNKEKKIVENSCKDLKIDTFHVGLPDNPVENVEDYINDTDIVVTLGRGALEAMACERNVIVYDTNGGDGFISKNNFYEIKKFHFSGKTYKYDYTVEDFKKEILKYNPLVGKDLRKLVLQENSIDVIARQFENIYENIPNISYKSQIKQEQLYKEFYYLEDRYLKLKRQNNNITSINNNIIKQKNKEIREKDIMLKQKSKQLNKIYKSSMGKLYWAIYNPWKFVKKYLKIPNNN